MRYAVERALTGPLNPGPTVGAGDWLSGRAPRSPRRLYDLNPLVGRGFSKKYIAKHWLRHWLTPSEGPRASGTKRSGAVGAAGARPPHTRKVAGSIPARPTWIERSAASGCRARRRTVSVVQGTPRPASLPRRWSARDSGTRSASLRTEEAITRSSRPGGIGHTSCHATARPRISSTGCWRPRGTPAAYAESRSRTGSVSASTTTTSAARNRPEDKLRAAASAYAGCCASGATPGLGGWRRTERWRERIFSKLSVFRYGSVPDLLICFSEYFQRGEAV
jgi:hypothetical protein